MLVSSALNGGFRPYVAAEAIEFLGAYLVGRAFVFGPPNCQTFLEALKPITGVIIALALLDTLSGRYITLDSFGVPNFWIARFGLVRASSVFEGAEHYGTFCVAAASLFLYSERGIRRALWVSLSLFGCALSLSSGPLLGLGILMTLFSWDRILKRHSWRWKTLTAIIAAFVLSICIFSDHPIEWALIHFTLDPQTGFFRLETWNHALPLIGESLFVGHGLVQLGGSGDALMYLTSVDCLWLLEALRYGLPAVILLGITMFSPLLTRTSILRSCGVQTGFSLTIIIMAMIGLTVHFWDATWLFLNLCVGIRASLAEYSARKHVRALQSLGRVNGMLC
jgi:hypothetical protein